MIGPGGSTAFDTPIGGRAVQYINKTGAVSVKGTAVDLSTTDDFAVGITETDDPDSIGIIYESGIADGSPVWVVTFGPADVLLEDGTASTRGYWVRSSITQAGRADATNANPPGGTINEIDNHFREMGHCMQSVTSGIDKLARVHIHHN